MTGGPGHQHDFDPVSGWCQWCNLRQDGRLISTGGHVWHVGHEHTLDEAIEATRGQRP